ncbi:hypothetical protein ACIRPH_30985 [Nocardiopsis sp. NPDC101807]|uniref:hypothetical protein n=1 Tax=Nocardiopsis sp. NPDC101807 TaxID=3364339 RepID=UPI0037FE7948
MDILAPLIDILRALKDPALLVAGSVLAWIGGALQANRTNNLQVDRERQAHYDKILRLLSEEQAKPFDHDHLHHFTDLRHLLDTIPRGHGKRRKRLIRDVEAECLRAIQWHERLHSPTFKHYMLQENLPAETIHQGLLARLSEVVRAAFQGVPLPDAPALYKRLGSIDRKATELDVEYHEAEAAAWADRDDDSS